MCYEAPEFEVIIQGHSLVKVADGGVRIDGQNFHTDLKNISALVDILNDVLDAAQEVKRPRLVA